MQTKNLSEAKRLLIAALNSRGVETTDASMYGIAGRVTECNFVLSFMPGNRRTLISHAVYVYEEHRGKGVGTKMNKLREEAAREAGVTLMLATVLDENVPEVRVLEKCGWSRLTQNHTTHCSLWGKQLL